MAETKLSLDDILNKPSRKRQAQMDAQSAKPQKKSLRDRAFDWALGDSEPKDPKKQEKWEAKKILPKLTPEARSRYLKHKAQGQKRKERKEYKDTEYKGMGTYGRTGAEHGILGG